MELVVGVAGDGPVVVVDELVVVVAEHDEVGVGGGAVVGVVGEVVGV